MTRKAYGKAKRKKLLGASIKRIRTLKGMTQKELADAAGLSLYSIRTYEQGTRRPDIRFLESLAKALDISADNFDTYEIETDSELVHALFLLEDAFHLHPNSDGSLRFGNEEVCRAMKEWASMRDRLASGEISKMEYEDWKTRYTVLQVSEQSNMR